MQYVKYTSFSDHLVKKNFCQVLHLHILHLVQNGTIALPLFSKSNTTQLKVIWLTYMDTDCIWFSTKTTDVLGFD